MEPMNKQGKHLSIRICYQMLLQFEYLQKNYTFRSKYLFHIIDNVLKSSSIENNGGKLNNDSEISMQKHQSLYKKNNANGSNGSDEPKFVKKYSKFNISLQLMLAIIQYIRTIFDAGKIFLFIYLFTRIKTSTNKQM